jgi:hypothetical protein
VTDNGDVFYFQPQPIGFDQLELINSMRGEYVWNAASPMPSGWPVIDVYHRSESPLWWKNLETAEGVYDFAVFNSYLDEAAQGNVAENKSELGRLGCRIMAYYPANPFGSDNLAPSYVPTQPSPAKPSRERTGLDSEAFLRGWENMMAALAKFVTNRGFALKDDLRLGFIDVGGYGSWGGWHIYTDNGPLGAPITSANADRVIRAATDNFPGRSVLMMTANIGFLLQRLNASPNVGIRIDCLGYPGFMGSTIDQLANEGNDAFGNRYQDRWQKAPYVSEWCHATKDGVDEAHQGLTDVTGYHFSLLSSGNFPTSWANLTAQQQADFRMANMSAGFRYRLVELGMPAHLTRGDPFDVFWTWANDGSAPTYDTWNVNIQMRNSVGQISWSGTSGIDLSHVFGSAIEETVTMPPCLQTSNQATTPPSSSL